MTPHLRTLLTTLLTLLVLSQSVFVAAMPCTMQRGNPEPGTLALVDNHAHHARSHDLHREASLSPAADAGESMAVKACCELDICSAGGCASPLALSPVSTPWQQPATLAWLRVATTVSPLHSTETPERPPSA